MQSPYLPSWTDFPDLTRLIRLRNEGDMEAERRLFQIGYRHLCGLAKRLLNLEAPAVRAHTTPNDLLHDVYVARIHSWRGSVNDRHHFTAIIANAMKNELIDRARIRDSAKRTPVHGFPNRMASALTTEEIVSLNRELARLREYDPRAAEIVHLRYYGGCSWDETAVAANVSVKKARTEWECAARWLAERLGSKSS